jgi:hypothetical protein
MVDVTIHWVMVCDADVPGRNVAVTLDLGQQSGLCWQYPNGKTLASSQLIS